jgi:hypothetical protein
VTAGGSSWKTQTQGQDGIPVVIMDRLSAYETRLLVPYCRAVKLSGGRCEFMGLGFLETGFLKLLCIFYIESVKYVY